MKKQILLSALLAFSLAAVGCSSVSTPGPDPSSTPDSTAPQRRRWSAWLDKMPVGAPRLHVGGEVYVPNGGTDAKLTRAVPQGINPTILILDLTLVETPGLSTQALKWVAVRYDENPATVAWTEVSIRYNGAIVENLKVKTVE